jgi:DNA invertase Pin-like site-specific DNA recombinase
VCSVRSVSRFDEYCGPGSLTKRPGRAVFRPWACWDSPPSRVSSLDQILDRQIAALRAEGCDRIYREKASGKDMRNKPELAKAIDALPTKGVLVLAEWDRATRSLIDGIHIMERVHKRGAYIKVLDRPGLDLTTPSGRGILALLSGLAEEERTRILRRANDGRVAAIKLGRKSKLDDHQQQEAIARLKTGESLRTIESYRVHHATIGRLAG